jgi:hypothetical protein
LLVLTVICKRLVIAVTRRVARRVVLPARRGYLIVARVDRRLQTASAQVDGGTEVPLPSFDFKCADAIYEVKSG